MIVKFLDPNDFAIFRSLRLEALRTEPDAYASTLEDWESLSEDGWRSRLEGHPVVVAIVEGQPVGMMGLMRERSSKAAHRATIIMVYARPEHRGKGVAAALLQALIQRALELGIRQLELLVNAENRRALRFYQRSGFAEIGRIPGALLHEGRSIDEIMMARRIDG